LGRENDVFSHFFFKLATEKLNAMKTIITLLQVCTLALLFQPAFAQQPDQVRKLHIIIIGAHPDDPDKVGGTAYKWAQMPDISQ
jgi:hypothetical protein